MEELKCPLCKKQYTESNPPRLLIMCGHTFCHHCIKNLIKRKEYRYQIRCPEDRQTLMIDSATPSHFPRNMVLIDAINKSCKSKQQIAEDKNQFLIELDNKRQAVRCQDSRRESIRNERNSLKSSFINMRRVSLQEGFCLLHQKPLDIICMQEKLHICAQCALFGLHKGHKFTTIKELQVKRNDWLHNVLELVEDKKTLESKCLMGQFQKQITVLLHKKKQLLIDEISQFYQKLMVTIKTHQQNNKLTINKKIEQMEISLKQGLVLDSEIQQQFKTWQNQIEQRMIDLQTEDIMCSLNLFLDQNNQLKEDLVAKGKGIVQKMKNDIMTFWSSIQMLIQYPKIQYLFPVQNFIDQSVKILLEAPPPSILTSNSNNSCLEDLKPNNNKHDRKISDFQLQITSPDDHQFSLNPCFNHHAVEDISLLDMSNFKQQTDRSMIRPINSQDLSMIISSLGMVTQDKFNMGEQSQIISPKKMKRVKSRQLTINMSIVNTTEKAINFNSPKMRKKTQFASRTNITSPSVQRSKLKKFVLRAKQPDKFEKIITGIEADCIQTADFTGFQLGDQIAKQLLLKVGEGKKMRMLRLMKNQLTDECIKEVGQALRVVEILNLAQNSFTEKLLQYLLECSRLGRIPKGKSVQLGQNKINSRKFKDKIDELKQLGIIITL